MLLGRVLLLLLLKLVGSALRHSLLTELRLHSTAHCTAAVLSHHPAKKSITCSTRIPCLFDITSTTIYINERFAIQCILRLQIKEDKIKLLLIISIVNITVIVRKYTHYEPFIYYITVTYITLFPPKKPTFPAEIVAVAARSFADSRTVADIAAARRACRRAGGRRRGCTVAYGASGVVAPSTFVVACPAAFAAAASAAASAEVEAAASGRRPSFEDEAAVAAEKFERISMVDFIANSKIC